MSVVTRFAPSPTGYLHIGGARTALYNWLFAKHHKHYGDGGKFLLRIEDTDKNRSSAIAVEAIYKGLNWLGLDWDGEAVSQTANLEIHKSIVKTLLDSNKAYYCYSSLAELQKMRQTAREEGRTVAYNGFWRDRDPELAPDDISPVVRLKTPLAGVTVINDLVQGEIAVKNETIDDMVLLRADGTPTYMLAVVVDDYNMGVTHVIRGDDHLTNAFRQLQIYNALEWDIPQYAHIPLIHGADGKKMSKRHGELSIDAYRDFGILPEALRNYLLRLGWSHGNEEIISTKAAIEWFSIKNIGRSPAKFDLMKLENLNSQYLRALDNGELLRLVCDNVESILGKEIDCAILNRIRCGMDHLKKQSKTLKELSTSALLFTKDRPISIDEHDDIVFDIPNLKHLTTINALCRELDDWSSESINSLVKEYILEADTKLKEIAPILRLALLGVKNSPGIFDVMSCLGKKETLDRFDDFLEKFLGKERSS